MADEPVFKPGETVEIIHGPFQTCMGVIKEVNHEKQCLKVMVDLKDSPHSRVATVELSPAFQRRESCDSPP